MATVSKSANEAADAAATHLIESSRSISEPLLNAIPSSHTSPRQRLIAANKAAHMVNSSFNHHAVTAIPMTTSPCDRTNDTAAWTNSMSNSTVAPTQTPTAAKQPAVAPPSLTLKIPIIPASSNGSNIARKVSFSGSAQNLPRGEMLRSTVQPFNRHTYSRTFTTKPHHSRLAGHGNQAKGHTMRGTHSNSMTWTTDARTMKGKWIPVEKELKRRRFLPSDYPPYPAYPHQTYEEWLANYPKHSPFVPKTFEEYVGHLAAFKAANAKRAALQVEHKELVRTLKSRDRSEVKCTWASRTPTDGRSAFFAFSTIWSIWPEPTTTRPQAPWPSLEEMDEEGNQRAMSKSSHGDYGRFPPLPRVPANDTVVWKQRAMLMPTDFDQVRMLIDCIRPRTKQAEEIEERYKETIRREAEETMIAWGNRKSDRFWEEKIEEGLNNGLPADVARDIADVKTTAIAREIAIAKLLQEGEAKIRAEMLEVFPQSFVNALNYNEDNELEEKEKDNNKENKEIEGNKKGSKNKG